VSEESEVKHPNFARFLDRLSYKAVVRLGLASDSSEPLPRAMTSIRSWRYGGQTCVGS